MGVEKAELLKLVSRASGSHIAIIFVHGLRGDPRNTWRKKGSPDTLPEILGLEAGLQTAELYSYGYRTGIRPRQYDFKVAAELLYSEIRAHLPNRALLFVTHSMGGLVVQQYMVHRYEAGDEPAIDAVRGIAYLSVPFRGSFWAGLMPKWAANKQLRSLRKDNPDLTRLEESWSSCRAYLEDIVPQLALRGARDDIVAESSSTPLYLGATKHTVDEDHRSICKVDKTSTVYKMIREFLCKAVGEASSTRAAVVVHIHGYSRLPYQEPSLYELNWTDYFDVQSSPKRLPTAEQWEAMTKSLNRVSNDCLQSHGSSMKLRLYAKLCLPGGVLIGNKYPQTRGCIVEVLQGDQLWSSNRRQRDYPVVTKRILGGNLASTHAVVILSVSNNIEQSVVTYLAQSGTAYRVAVQLLPPYGPGQDSIKNGREAAAYAMAVKLAADELKSHGIETMDLFLNCPFAVAVFVGHFLTSVSPIQVYDYANPGYIPACRL